jgi:cob(I)alamin adenosyltransferase
MRITRVTTRKGDDGTTGLGGGQRVLKDSLRVKAYGAVGLEKCFNCGNCTAICPLTSD